MGRGAVPRSEERAPSRTRSRRSSSSSATTRARSRARSTRSPTWAGDEPVGEREVEALVPSNADVPIYELTEAWSVRDPARALAVCETIFEHDPKPRRDVAPRLAGSLASHLGRLRDLKRLAAEGVKPKEAAERAQAAPVPRTEAVRTGGGLLRRGARRCGAAPRRARRCAEGAEQARPRPRGAAHARRAQQAPFLTRDLPRQTLRRRSVRDEERVLGRARDEPRGARLLARSGVAVERAARRGAIDRPHELAMLGGSRARRRRRRRPPRGASSAS